MKPYLGNLPQMSEIICDNHMLQARRVVENTFELLASVFRSFRQPLLVDLEHSEAVILLSANFLRMRYTSTSILCHLVLLTDSEDTKNRVTIPRKWRQTTTGDRVVVNLTHNPQGLHVTLRQKRKNLSIFYMK